MFCPDGLYMDHSLTIHKPLQGSALAFLQSLGKHSSASHLNGSVQARCMALAPLSVCSVLQHKDALAASAQEHLRQEMEPSTSQGWNTEIEATALAGGGSCCLGLSRTC